MTDQYWHKGGFGGIVVRAALRTLQFAFAVVVAGLYGVDLAHATKTGAHANPSWVYAEVVACMSALTCIVHCFVTVKRIMWCVWDWVLFVLWVAQFGVFGTIFIGGKNAEELSATQSVLRMKIAAWINLVNMLLWFATAMHGIVWCIGARRITRRTDKLDPREVEEGKLVEDELEETKSEQDESEPPKYDPGHNGSTEKECF